ncbi:MAG: hypothetical protein EB078_02145 [Proteobacteria bacterium]|nr:hypothetical protein [Pseudomonadota bacterium]NDC23591.1 hypothetical protein [Pseudomonadota bacterium]NDD03683.1 hypothetical protein [Pseudomonadota bacterium]NDG25778.1 hypothetical protein [Pseudomonadota bacterium]
MESLKWGLPSNVLPLFPKKAPHLFYLCNEESPEEKWLDFIPEHPVCSLSSEEQLRNALMATRPQLLLMRSDLNWTEPLPLIRELSNRYQCPIVLVLNKKKSKAHESLIRLAYQAGIFDLLFLPLGRDNVRETLEVLLRWSAQA